MDKNHYKERPVMRAYAFVGLLFIGVASATMAQTKFLNSMPYRGFEDSPFRDNSYLYFYLEDFEDGKLNTPGVSVTEGAVVIGEKALKSPYVDSVDEDDGQVDGSGSKGHSLWSHDNTALSFVFDEHILGKLPTHVGIVWTDGSSPATITLSAFDGKGELIGRSNPTQLGDRVITGTVGEDCFFGVYYKGGISRIIINTLSPDFEVDHLQYGLEMPCHECNQEHSILGETPGN